MRAAKYAVIFSCFLALFSCMSLPVAVVVPTGDPVAIHGVGASSEQMPNGVTRLHFTVRVDVFTTPLEFSYHWERSDGAQSTMQIRSVQPGTTSIPVSTTWDLGSGAPRGEVWEKLYINTGNTHLVSDPVRIALQ